MTDETKNVSRVHNVKDLISLGKGVGLYPKDEEKAFK